jgi:hypothetical protein
MTLSDRTFSGHVGDSEPIDAHRPVGVLDEDQIGTLVLARLAGRI